MAFYPIIDHARKRTCSYFLTKMTAREFAECAVACREAGSLPYTHLIVVSGAAITVQSTDILWISNRIREIAGPMEIGPVAIVAEGVREFGQLRMLSAMVSDVCEMTVHTSCSAAIDHLNWKMDSIADAEAVTAL